MKILLDNCVPYRVRELPIPIVEINTLFTRFEDIRVLAPFFPAALEAMRSFLFVSIGPEGALETLAPRTQPLEFP